MSSANNLLSSKIRLNNGILMPRIHLGVYETSGLETYNAVTTALQSGYLGFDSAEWYANEAEVGSAIKSYIAANERVKREDIWFTTKLEVNEDYDKTRGSIRNSLEASGFEQIDLYLLHSPIGGTKKRKDCWRAIQDAISIETKAGKKEVKVGGVSNFGVRHLQELLDAFPDKIPSVNQIEVHPFNTQKDITSFCKEKGIVVQAYAPLAKGMRMNHPKIVELSRKYRCTPAQLMIRWSLQHGYVPLPKSVHQERIVENGNVGGFEIEEGDMQALDGLDEKLVTDWDPTNVV